MTLSDSHNRRHGCSSRCCLKSTATHALLQVEIYISCSPDVLAIPSIRRAARGDDHGITWGRKHISAASRSPRSSPSCNSPSTLILGYGDEILALSKDNQATTRTWYGAGSLQNPTVRQWILPPWKLISQATHSLRSSMHLSRLSSVSRYEVVHKV